MSENPFGLIRQFFAACCAHYLSAKADKFHTCSLRCVFVHVHAAAENDFHFLRRFGGELCEAFLTVCVSPVIKTGDFFYFGEKNATFPENEKPGGQIHK